MVMACDCDNNLVMSASHFPRHKPIISQYSRPAVCDQALSVSTFTKRRLQIYLTD